MWQGEKEKANVVSSQFFMSSEHIGKNFSSL